MRIDLQGRTALVTGGARGLGRAIGSALAESGARVALADLDGAGAERVAAELGTAAMGIEMDVTDARSVATATGAVRDGLGGVSILVNNAGACALTGFRELELPEWERLLGVNLTGSFLCMKAVVEQMIELGGGAVVNIGSLAGRSGGIMVSAAYSASKAGVAGLTKAAAGQLAGDSIRVNCIAPSTLRTDMTAGWDPAGLEAVRQRVPLGRLGEVDDVVGAVLYLLSDAARYVTGVTLDINGGLYIAP